MEWQGIWRFLAQVKWGPFLENLKAFAEIVALIVAGIWAWLLFVRKREKFPKASLKHEVVTLPFQGDRQLLHIILTITNPSTVLLKVGKGWTRVHRMRPLERGQEAWVDEDRFETGEFDWPELGRQRDFDEGSIEIEPGETDEVHSEFLIPSNTEQVMVYGFVGNPTKEEGFGWPLTTIHKLSEELDEAAPKETLMTTAATQPAKQQTQAPVAGKNESKQQKPKPSHKPSQQPPKKPPKGG